MVGRMAVRYERCTFERVRMKQPTEVSWQVTPRWRVRSSKDEGNFGEPEDIWVQAIVESGGGMLSDNMEIRGMGG
jgi:hypothetical protein